MANKDKQDETKDVKASEMKAEDQRVVEDVKVKKETKALEDKVKADAEKRNKVFTKCPVTGVLIVK